LTFNFWQTLVILFYTSSDSTRVRQKNWIYVLHWHVNDISVDAIEPIQQITVIMSSQNCMERKFHRKFIKEQFAYVKRGLLFWFRPIRKRTHNFLSKKMISISSDFSFYRDIKEMPQSRPPYYDIENSLCYDLK
jgi:hypothetical protein